MTVHVFRIGDYRKVGPFNVHASLRNFERGRRQVVVALVALCAYLGSNSVAGQESEIEPSWRDGVSGELRIGLDAARSSRDNDFSLDQVLRLNIDPPQHERIHIRSTLWTIQDLDGSEDPTSTLRSLSDASSSDVQARLLSLYLEVDDLGGDSTLRIGRQRITDGVVYNRIDGAYFKWRDSIWEAYAFGGARASVYEDAHEDFSTGAGASLRLPTNTRVGVDYFYGNDERRDFGTGDIESSITTVSVRQSLTKQHSAYGRASWFDTELDELRFMAQGFFTEREIVYSVSYYNRLSTLAERVTDVSEFYRVIGEFNEFQDVHALVDIPIATHFGLGLEAQVHDAEDASLESGNRDFQRYGLSLDLFDLGGHYDATAIVEYWDVDFGEGQWTVTGEVSREWEDTEAALGIDYIRFQDRVTQFDPNAQNVFTVESHENIYSFYLKVKHEINERHGIRVYGIFEEDDGPDSPYWRLRAEYTLRF